MLLNKEADKTLSHPLMLFPIYLDVHVKPVDFKLISLHKDSILKTLELVPNEHFKIVMPPSVTF